jgi:cytochrome c6
MKTTNFFFNLLILYFFIFFFSLKDGNTTTFEIGKELFTKNCIVCHMGGNNIIIPEKNLKKDSLDENGMNTINAISYQILNGKNGMPAFGGRLKESEIEVIAKYVLEESGKNFIN